jgi:hypothetical protein
MKEHLTVTQLHMKKQRAPSHHWHFLSMAPNKFIFSAGCQWLMPVILDIWGDEIRRIEV